MARPAPRALATAPASSSLAARFERLLESAADLARTGPADALGQVLRETDRLIVQEGERLASDPAAAGRLRSMQSRILALGDSLEAEQRRIARDLAALEALAHTQARFVPPLQAAQALDRRG